MKQVICIKSRKECQSILVHSLNQLPFIFKATPLNSFLMLIDYDNTAISESNLLLAIEKTTLNVQLLDYPKNSSAITWMISILLFMTHTIGIMLMPATWSIPTIFIVLFSIINLSVYWINYWFHLTHFKFKYQDGLNVLQCIFLLNALLSSNPIHQYQYVSIFLGLCLVATSESMIHSYIHYQTLRPYAAYIKAINESLNIKTGATFLPIHPFSIKQNDTVAYRKGNVIVTDGYVVNGNATLNGVLNQQNTMHAHKDSMITSGYKVVDGYIEVLAESTVESSYLSRLYQGYKNSLCEPDLDLLNKNVNESFSVGALYAFAIIIAMITSFISFISIPLLTWLQIASFFLYLTHLFCNVNLYRNSIYTSFKNHTLVNNPSCIGQATHYDQVWIPRRPYLFKNYKVNDVLVANDIDQTTFNHILYSVHKRKNDELSLAIASYLKSQNIKDTNLSLTKSIFAKGIDTVLNGSKVTYKSIEQCEKESIDLSAFKNILEQYRKEGKLIALYVKDEQIIGLITLVDVMIPSSLTTIHLLQSNNTQCVLLDDLDNAHQTNLAHQLNMSASYSLTNVKEYESALTNAQFEQKKTIVTISNDKTSQLYASYADLNVSFDINQNSDLTILDGQLSTLPAWLLFKADWVKLSQKLSSITHLLPAILSLTFLVIILLFNQTISLDIYGLLYLLTLLASNAIRFYVEHRLMHLQYVENIIPVSKTTQLVIEDCISDYDITQVRNALAQLSDCKLSFDLQKRLATITSDSSTSLQQIESAIAKAGYKIKR